MPMPTVLQSWTHWAYLAAFVALLAGTGAAGSWIRNSDAVLRDAKTPRSAALEWRSSPRRAQAIVDAWDAKGLLWPATRGTLIDTFLFIPFYSTLFALCGFWCAAGIDLRSPWHTVYLAMAWCGWVAGALDLIENAGILVEVRARWFFVAPATAAAAWLKWAILAASVLMIVGRVVRALLARWS